MEVEIEEFISEIDMKSEYFFCHVFESMTLKTKKNRQFDALN